MMWAFVTTGTKEFLEKLMERHTNVEHLFMQDHATTLVYYESKRKRSIFASGRRFEVLYEKNELWHLGYVVMQHLPVDKQAATLFLNEFEKHKRQLNETGSLLAARLLKEHRKNTYVLLTQWKTATDYKRWKKANETKQSFFANMTRLPAYFAHRPFTNTYIIQEENEA